MKGIRTFDSHLAGKGVKNCVFCAMGDSISCGDRWGYMRRTFGLRVGCWRPIGCLLVWDEVPV